MEQEGFVDEKAVSAMLASPIQERSVSYPADLVLSVDDMDFAGWRACESIPATRVAEVPPQVIHAIMRGSTPPLNSAAMSTVTPHEANARRWWMAGAFTVLLASAVAVGVAPGPRATFESVRIRLAAALSPATAPHAPQPSRIHVP